MKKLMGLLSLLALMTLASCGGGGDGGGTVVVPPQPVDKVQSFIDLLNSRYLYDSSYYVAKRPEMSATEGFVVVYSQDTGYIAYDLKYYLQGDSWSTYSTYAEYQPVYIHSTSNDVYTNEVFYFGDAFQNTYTGSYVGEFMFDETSETGKDLEKAYALIEAHKNSKIADALSSEFGLSEERGLKIAKLVTDWKKLSKSRSMTSADANVFTKELLGVDMQKAETAIKKHLEGDDSQMSDVLKKAAKANGTTPEHMNELLNTVFAEKA